MIDCLNQYSLGIDWLSFVTLTSSVVIMLYLFIGNTLTASRDRIRNIAYWIICVAASVNIFSAFLGSALITHPQHVLLYIGVAIFVVNGHYRIKAYRDKNNMSQHDIL